MTNKLEQTARTRVENSVAWLPQSELEGRITVFFLTATFALLLSILLTGCGAVQVRAGKKPDVNLLNQSLQVGHSTQQDVRKALGSPNGQGRSMLPWQSAPRTVWTYYYEEGVIDLSGGNSDDRQIFLFIFLDGERFDGYVWFSSLKPSP